MKLQRAEFTNFRILRNLIIDFSTDPEKRLTVIRAENETGKTTIQTALQWGLHGDPALPGGRSSFRIHPIDWDISEGTHVPIVVEIDFETRGKSYRIIRSTYDTVEGVTWRPGPTNATLFEITPSGNKLIAPPDAWIQEELPIELREIFFTDGDRALSFIEADVNTSTKQRRVREAIRSLLGLEVVEAAIGHVKKAVAEATRQTKAVSSDDELSGITDQLLDLEEAIENGQQRLSDAEAQFASFDEALVQVNKRIEDAALQGNREDLQRELADAEQSIKRLDSQLKDAEEEHTNLFKHLALARGLAAPSLSKGLAKLDQLRDQGKIPNSTIPVLEERLIGGVCICGASLDGSGGETEQRRQHVEHLIEESRTADAIQTIMTDLYYGSRDLQEMLSFEDRWPSLLGKTRDRRATLEDLRDEAGRRRQAVEAKIGQLPNVDIEQLYEQRRYNTEQRDRFNNEKTRLENDLENLNKGRNDLTRRHSQLARQQARTARVMADADVARDIQGVLENTYQRLTTEELGKVSDAMNAIFLEMIGADPQQNAIIREARISQDFEILVYGASNRPLNPDRDLNGASRRALTLAFILALTKVSDQEAPNVIDTPLATMSGYVKRSVLATTIRESYQLILFLTRSEIADCEDILDDQAAQVITLTNPGHYPVMLVNDFREGEVSVLRCQCNHRQECSKCQRKAYNNAEAGRVL